jgi:hypothetical protein
MVLWHRFDAAKKDFLIFAGTEVLDYSGHGSLGEFLTAPIIPTRCSSDYGIKMFGDWKSGEALGYRIMESDELTLQEGTLCFWVWVDEDNNKDGTLISSIADKKSRIAIKAKKGKMEVVSSLTSKKTMKGSADYKQWGHVAITFGKDGSKLFIDGKEIANDPDPGSLNGSEGFWVGHDEKYKNGFAGVLEDLKIYKKVLSEIEDAKQSPASKFPPEGLILHYDFQDA